MYVMLTLIGYFLYFLGSAKGTDEARKFYNPCNNDGNYQQVIAKSELDRIGR